MRKQLIYAGMLLVAVGFSACNEDFKDWADPQSNPQEDAATQVSITFAPGKDAAIVMDNAQNTEFVEIAKIASSTAKEGSTYMLRSLVINENHIIPYTFTEDNAVKVDLAQLDSVTQEAYKSRASVSRNLKLKLVASAITPTGEGLMSEASEVTITLTPESTPEIDADGYYVVREGKEPVAMVKQADVEGLYILDVDDMVKDETFKIYPAAAISGTAVVDETKALGVADEEGNMNDNFVVWSDAKSIKSGFVEKVKIKLDVVNYRFAVEDNNAFAAMYMTGSYYDWGKIWKPLIPVNGMKGCFWGIFYFDKDEEVKFAPQAGWGNDFGFAATISEASVERAALSDNGGNIKVGNAGWYLVYASGIGAERVVEFEEPKVYLIGDVAAGGWGAQLASEDLFTVPDSRDGQFVSPAFAQSANARICVHPATINTDWWRTEFIVRDGVIEYRGDGGDQEPVSVSAGQKAYLNFTEGTGEIK